MKLRSKGAAARPLRPKRASASPLKHVHSLVAELVPLSALRLRHKNPRRARGRRKAGTPNTKTMIRKAHAKSVKLRTKDGRVRRKRALEHLVELDVLDGFSDKRTRWRNIDKAMDLDAEEEARAAVRAQDALLAEDEAIINRYLDSLADPPPPPAPPSDEAAPQKEEEK